MRCAIVCVVLGFAVGARADVTVSPPSRPHTPLGERCDAALARAQEEFSTKASSVHFRVRQQTLSGSYQWSDMCGVWGEYTVELAPDPLPSQPWRWKVKTHGDESSGTVVTNQGTRRHGGWRARFFLRGDELHSLGSLFVDTFRPAMDRCLEAATQPQSVTATN